MCATEVVRIAWAPGGTAVAALAAVVDGCTSVVKVGAPASPYASPRASSATRDPEAWADRLGVDRSELLRDALRRHLLRLASENDATTWVEQPLEAGERALAAIADWGPAEDWSEWADAAR